MKYEVGQVIYAIDPCKMDFDGRSTLSIGLAYRICEVVDYGFFIIDDEGTSHFFDYDEAGKFFSTEKSLNGGAINAKDQKQEADDELSAVEGGSKYSPEQIAYLDQCAIAAMQGSLSSEVERSTIGAPIDKAYIDYLTTVSYNIAEAMLQEKERRVKG